MQVAVDTCDTYIEVKQKCIGFGTDCSDECLIFVRKETAEMWSTLETKTALGVNLLVGGPPGTGKSTEAWAWARWKAHATEKKVTWFHFSKVEKLKVEIDGLNRTMITYSANISDIDSSEGDFLVVDGVTKEASTDIYSRCVSWRRSQPGRVFVAISSVSSIVISVEQLKDAKICKHTVPSWTFEQYVKACENMCFFQKVEKNLRCPSRNSIADKDELLLSKYEFAGGCARWMFDFTFDEWKTDFGEHIEKVVEYKIVFTEAGGDATQDAVNHLRGLTMKGMEKRYFFISQHALKELSEKCSDKRNFIIDSYKKAAETANPSYLGWIFEFDVDYQIEFAKLNKTNIKVECRVSKEVEELCVTDYITYTDMHDVISRVKKLRETEILWAKPQLWCQKAFDFLYFLKKGDEISMIAVNASHGLQHTLLLNVVNSLAVSCGSEECIIDKIRFDFYVPPTASDFCVSKVYGRLCGLKNLKGQDWPNGGHAIDYSNNFVAIRYLSPTT